MIALDLLPFARSAATTGEDDSRSHSRRAPSAGSSRQRPLRMSNNLQRVGALSMLAGALISSFGPLAQGTDNGALAQSNPAASASPRAMPRAPVPFERKGPASAGPTAADSVPVPRRAVSGPADNAESAGLTSRRALDINAAKAAVEADGYKRVMILGPATNGAWRAKGYRGDTEVGLSVAADGSVTME